MKKYIDLPDVDISDIPSIADRSQAGTDCEIPDAVIKRLPRYFRCLRELLNRDVVRISSNELSELTDVSAPQLRQDLKYFGGLGQRGYGYNVMRLYSSISEKLGVGCKYSAVIVGAGNLGTALANSRLFEQRGVWIKGIFDISADVIGKRTADAEVMDASGLKGFCRKNRIDIAVLCIPESDPGELEKLLDGTGVRGVWNLCPCEYKSKDGNVTVVNLCTGDSLMLLTYGMSEGKEKRKNENKA
ncbi:MAG: redox-sensing transcriptional repressor Rex [Clostridia bacterium]|nr:redox-sensing transcriptional repressor Rex [Clostridia bacterium]